MKGQISCLVDTEDYKKTETMDFHVDLRKTFVETYVSEKMGVMHLIAVLVIGRARSQKNRLEADVPEAPVHLSPCLHGGSKT